LHEHSSFEGLAHQLPESSKQLERMIAASGPPPTPKPPVAAESMPEAMHFFFSPRVRRQVERALGALDGDRHQALLKALNLHEVEA
jgi:hypothetical protein